MLSPLPLLPVMGRPNFASALPTTYTWNWTTTAEGWLKMTTGGSEWVSTNGGSILTRASVGDYIDMTGLTSLAAGDTVNVVFFCSNSNCGLRVWNGSGWTNLGSSIASGATTNFVLPALWANKIGVFRSADRTVYSLSITKA